jgi:hypothetical protein
MSGRAATSDRRLQIVWEIERKGDHFKMRWQKLPNPAKFIHVVWEILRFDLSDQLKFQQTTGSVLRDHFSDYTPQEPDTTVHE